MKKMMGFELTNGTALIPDGRGGWHLKLPNRSPVAHDEAACRELRDALNEMFPVQGEGEVPKAISTVRAQGGEAAD